MFAFYLPNIIKTFQHVINIFKLLGDFTFCFRLCILHLQHFR